VSAAAKGLKFYEASHRYKLDGRWVPGVTTLIKGGLPKELKYWAARYVAEWVADNPGMTDLMAEKGGRDPLVGFLKELPFQFSKEAAVKGTDVHRLAEQLVHGHEVQVPEHLQGYVQSCVAFLDEWGVEPLMTERPIAHRAHWWAGTPDLFARVRDSRRLLFDYKTSGSGIWPEAAFQESAYRHGEFYLAEDGTEVPVPEVDFCAAVWLRQDGYDVIPLKADAEVYKEFRHIAFVAEAAKRAKGNKTTQGYVGFPMETPSNPSIEGSAA